MGAIYPDLMNLDQAQRRGHVYWRGMALVCTSHGVELRRQAGTLFCPNCGLVIESQDRSTPP